MLEEGIVRIDGPQGETKLLVICTTCRGAGAPFEHQVRWDRLLAEFEEMESGGEHLRTLVLPA